MGKDKVAAGVKGKSPKAGMVDPKGAWTKVQERTLAKNGMMMKPKGKGLPPAGKQRPVDFEPKSKFPVTKGGGDNYDETMKREKELKAKGMMKMGGSLKPVGDDKPGLKKLPTAVRNKMGYQKNGGAMKKAKDGTAFGMLSVKAGIDKNPNPTAADRIAGAKKMAKSGASMKKCRYGCK